MTDEQKELVGADAAAVDGSMATSADTVAPHVAPKKHALLCASRWVFLDRNGNIRKDVRRAACDCDGKLSRGRLVTVAVR